MTNTIKTQKKNWQNTKENYPNDSNCQIRQNYSNSPNCQNWPTLSEWEKIVKISKTVKIGQNQALKIKNCKKYMSKRLKNRKICIRFFKISLNWRLKCLWNSICFKSFDNSGKRKNKKIQITNMAFFQKISSLNGLQLFKNNTFSNKKN